MHCKRDSSKAFGQRIVLLVHFYSGVGEEDNLVLVCEALNGNATTGHALVNKAVTRN
jgi:hypothetical protein